MTALISIAAVAVIAFAAWRGCCKLIDAAEDARREEEEDARREEEGPWL